MHGPLESAWRKDAFKKCLLADPWAPNSLTAKLDDLITGGGEQLLIPYKG